jgi:hypothetical protein
MQTTHRNTHPLNVSYLVVGLVFLGISGVWALRSAGLVDTGQLGWLLPLTLVGAGTVGLVAFAAKGLRGARSGADDDVPAGDPLLDEPDLPPDSDIGVER